MVRIEGTQTIPASLMQDYKGALTEIMPNGVIRKRYPFRVPQLQDGGSRVSLQMARNRKRFKAVKDLFNALNPTERASLYSAAGSASTPLWYFNFHVQTSIPAILGHLPFGCDMINQIQDYFLELPTDGTMLVLSSSVNPAHCYINLRGRAHTQKTMSSSGSIDVYNAGIMPIVCGLYSGSVSLDYDIIPYEAVNISVHLIEFL